MLGKRKLVPSHFDEDESDDEPVQKQTAGQVYVFDVRWSYSKKYGSLEDFKKHTLVTETLKSAAGEKGKFIFQLECTHRKEAKRVDDEDTEDDNWHYQGYLKLQNKRRPKTLGAELGTVMPGIHVSPSSTNGQVALRNYCMKKDSTYRAGPWCETGEVEEPEPEYKGEDLPQTLYPWQQEIWDGCLEVPDDRSIHWVWDEEGGAGKTKLVKTMVFKRKDTAFLSFGNASDLKYQVVQGKAKKVYLLDLQRTKGKNEHMDDIYAAIEQVKNGMVFSTKYNGGFLMMAPPHIWVFSNYLPDKEKMSKDRFRIYSIENQKLSTNFKKSGEPQKKRVRFNSDLDINEFDLPGADQGIELVC